MTRLPTPTEHVARLAPTLPLREQLVAAACVAADRGRIAARLREAHRAGADETLRLLDELEGRAEPIDPLHPTGRCTCWGEGTCEWCKDAERREAIEPTPCTGCPENTPAPCGGCSSGERSDNCFHGAHEHCDGCACICHRVRELVALRDAGWGLGKSDIAILTHVPPLLCAVRDAVGGWVAVRLRLSRVVERAGKVVRRLRALAEAERAYRVACEAHADHDGTVDEMTRTYDARAVAAEALRAAGGTP